MTKLGKTAAATAAAMLAAAPAFAHGDHSLGFVATAIHWLSSPAHSLFAVVSGVAISALIIKSRRKLV